ncbi:MAG TPA: UvrB/UvrC motif-containing protein, partial [Methanospirillum sp.]|nr:UvrB/UvrC motif-containing protein [Methanospirillum sp.]
AFVVLYADTITGSMQKAIDETERRRSLQIQYNNEHGITPKTIQKPVREQVIDLGKKKKVPKSALPNLIINLESQMKSAAQRLDFEEAIRLRDQIAALRKEMEEGR